jgi:hypothetical protein
MSATVPASAEPRRSYRPSTVVLWVLLAALVASAPGLVNGVIVAVTWSLGQVWLVIPALLVVAAWRWRPHLFRSAGLLGRQQSKTN